jgi:PAS domain S-box-containing protein
VAAVALALVLTLGLWPVTTQAPFAFSFAAVMVSAWYGGLGPGLCAIALAVLGSAYFLLSPFHSLFVDTADNIIRLGLFVLVALLISVLTSQRRRAEEAERAQREYFQGTLASIGDAVIVTDPAGTVTFLNRIAEDITGWSLADAVGKPLPDVFHIVTEETRQAVENPVAKVLRTGTVAGLANSTVLVRRDGSDCPIDDSAAPIRDAHGRSVGVILVFRDITERRQAEETSLRLAAVVASSDDAIISKSLDGVVTSWNAAAERLFGYQADEMIGQPILRLLPEERHDEERVILERLRRGEHVDHFETVRRTKDGRSLDVSVTISPLRDTHGVIIGASKIARDITARKQAEAEREWLLAELQRANGEFQQFAYIVSHDLNEPLRTMSNYVQLLARQMKGTLDETTTEYMAFVTDAAWRMQQMLTDLLAYTRAGQAPEFQTVDCEVVLAQVLSDLQTRITECGAVITHDPLPTVQGDATRLGQVLQNLIGNALKFRTAVLPHIHVSAQRENGHWRFAVRDNGIGIDPTQVKRLFQVFQRLHTSSKYPGTGIGLAICKRIVEQHGGRIWVESQPSEGAIFYFTILSYTTDY